MAKIKLIGGATVDMPVARLPGRKVRTLREMSNGWGTVAAGTICTVEGTYRAGVELRSDPCPHCSVRIRISKVPRLDVEFYPEGS